ncbi:stage II sporulation protein D [Dysgonomonas sp. PFB1-18]|uniref:SpoIID/LytB domain-containing protein n=1 Tax=unclassified Dysgonomonas TaxID=2630389 RepID=UPI002474CAF4|nr:MULTISPECIES: SpoIID/LytB domain-containing protein [unclassified Dysgonomonas]MDH6308722.1 stage II sporulation protein D [Dysgonomonas sp. PF1-14]MDH6338581.1 stage II sporulation protein D [Dysgonomonas sp. PF1-16]MDH6379971.1 stage II sporulation protein D [Dysgonomonas sp. PFB1-18]MDH6397409.1 stage II sporulation protein D [Dysgonomonas sp. PF1-23]
MEPKVSIGILWNKAVSFVLNSDYSCLGKVVTEEKTVFLSNGQILWEGNMYDELYFEPQNDNASFTLKDVVIGIGFHWERKEDQVFQGALKLIVENDMITAVNIIGVEDYLTSVISSEMSATASPELLKAHAVISRSWLLAQIEKNKEIAAANEKYSTFTETEDEIIRWYDREDHLYFDVCADDHCQRYQGITRASANLVTVKQAISETWGQVLMSDNKICDARFSKCCGGVVEEFQNCWEDIPHSYLVKLRDSEHGKDIPDLIQETEAVNWIHTRPEAFCNTQDKKILGQVLNNYDQETVDFYRWQVTYSQEELSALVLKRSGIDFGLIEKLIPVQRGTSGRLVKLKIVGTKKTLTIGKELEIRRILSTSHLYSSAFTIDRKNDTFIVSGAGWGHGVGLCQIGAAVMGEQGYLYDRILLHYYVGASIETLY